MPEDPGRDGPPRPPGLGDDDLSVALGIPARPLARRIAVARARSPVGQMSGRRGPSAGRCRRSSDRCPAGSSGGACAVVVRRPPTPPGPPARRGCRSRARPGSGPSVGSGPRPGGVPRRPRRRPRVHGAGGAIEAARAASAEASETCCSRMIRTSVSKPGSRAHSGGGPCRATMPARSGSLAVRSRTAVARPASSRSDRTCRRRRSRRRSRSSIREGRPPGRRACSRPPRRPRLGARAARRPHPRHADRDHPRGHGGDHVPRRVADVPAASRCHPSSSAARRRRSGSGFAWATWLASVIAGSSVQPEGLDRGLHLVLATRGRDRPGDPVGLDRRDESADAGEWPRIDG